MKEVILIKYGEIALKGNNRRYFEQSLEKNLLCRTSLGNEYLERERGRIFLLPQEDKLNDILHKASNVFGVHECVRALRVSKNQEEIFDGARIVIERVKQKKTFKVETRRSDKKFEYTSDKMNALLGASLIERFPDLKVDLTHPECTLFLEIRNDDAFLYSNEDGVEGHGGFPVGTGGRGLLLLSGGIDSPVAGWMAMKRGISIDAIHFYSFPFTGEKAKEKVIDIAKRLSLWNLNPLRVMIVPFTALQKYIVSKAQEGYWTILFRRSMHRIAEMIALRDSYDTLITGDNLAQVASQTLKNINTIEGATSLFIMRPLISFDKHEIISVAKKIDTFALSILPYEDCCTVFTPSGPLTKSNPERVLAIEENLGLQALEEEAISRIEII